jgi:hypothetical protein
MNEKDKLASSYKDPAGFVFFRDGRIFRQVNACYKDDYDRLMETGLYEKLAGDRLLVPHKETAIGVSDKGYKIIEPETVPFVSYPYEWGFSQLKDAALCTLAVQREALNFGMVLKDASNFNIQFIGRAPIFIDTLSFEKYEDGEPWVAYRQFCEHFLAPLALAAYNDIRLVQLLKSNLDGIALDLAYKLLPVAAKINPGIFFHLGLHSFAQERSSAISAEKSLPKPGKNFSKAALIELIDSLESTIKKINWKPKKTVWTDYNGDDCESYGSASLKSKIKIVDGYLDAARPRFLWDIGANDGMYSAIAAKHGAFVVSMDNDPSVVEKNYIKLKEAKEDNILPLMVDITNPSPAVGWGNTERDALLGRKLPDTILALALIHHLAIAKNVPLDAIAGLFAGLCGTLVIEFVPKEDKQCRRLLASRQDIFGDYNEISFEEEFGRFFAVKEKRMIPGTGRIMYLMANKKNR